MRQVSLSGDETWTWLQGGIIVLVLCLIAASGAHSEGGEDGMTFDKLFVAGDGGYHGYRIPALVMTVKGTLLAFCEGRRESFSDHGDIDLLMRRSLDQGETWGPVQVVLHEEGMTCGNPCPIVDKKTGAVILLLTKNRGQDNQDQIMKREVPPRTAWVMRSVDDGATWSVPADISASTREPDWGWYATGPCHGIQLADGRLVAPCDHSTGPKNTELHAHVIYSDDGGATWHLGGSLEAGTDESTVLERVDGSLYLNMRSYLGLNRRAIATSRDRGMTWTPSAHDDALIEPVCQGTVIRYSTEADGGRNRILFCNPASTNRVNLTVRLSYDEGSTWPVSRMLWQGPSAYSDLVVCMDGRIGCLMECGVEKPYETIRFVRFTLEWLTSGNDRLE